VPPTLGQSVQIGRPNAMAAAVVFALALAGCGGGGSSPAPATVVPAAVTAPTTPVTVGPGIGSSAAAPAATQSGKALLIYIPNTSNIAVADSAISTGTAMTLNQGAAGGLASSQASATFASPLAGGTNVLGTGVLNRDPGTGLTAPAHLYDKAQAGAPSAVLIVYRYLDIGQTTSLSDSVYGKTFISDGNGGLALGSFHAGSATPVAQLPVTATYSGFFVGDEFRIGASTGASTPIIGHAKLNADFGKGTVSGTATNLMNNGTPVPPAPLPYDLRFNGTISGNTYTGTTAFTNSTGNIYFGTPAITNGPAIPTAVSSGLTGGFYGPGGAETTGAVRIQGLAPATAGGTINTVVTGSFGAKK
jgi:hypothetical protein